jgi:hypothetical protein
MRVSKSNFAEAFRQAVVQLREAEALVERNPSFENLCQAYVMTTIWARYWKENWPTAEGRRLWEEELAATKPDEERLIAALQRWGKRNNIEIVWLH